MDKMTIVGQNGKPKFVLTDTNKIVTVNDHCICTDEKRPIQWNGEVELCLICELPIV